MNDDKTRCEMCGQWVDDYGLLTHAWAHRTGRALRNTAKPKPILSALEKRTLRRIVTKKPEYIENRLRCWV